MTLTTQAAESYCQLWAVIFQQMLQEHQMDLKLVHMRGIYIQENNILSPKLE